jgi:hypothetical protein
MWQPLLKILDWVGRVDIAVAHQTPRVQAGNVNNPSIEGGTAWKKYLGTEVLWQTWGPAAGSPWEPFHCVTLFAAIDAARRNRKDDPAFAPCGEPPWHHLLQYEEPLPAWAESQSVMLMLDFPGPMAVHAGYSFAYRGGFQPVCTFDNWPNRFGVLRPEDIISAMLYYAPYMDQIHQSHTARSLPMWLCDFNRNGRSKPGPSQYDNRYALEDRLLPGPQLLLANGIDSVVYLTEEAPRIVSWDVIPWLRNLAGKGITVYLATLADEKLYRDPTPIRMEDSSKVILKSNQQARSLMRSSAGGFGAMIPEPSSSGG